MQKGWKMKLRTAISISFVVLLITLCISYGQHQTEWRGKIEYEDGVKVVVNPKEPLYGEITLELEEDLSIGNDNEDDYLFFNVRDVEVDEAGNIYVLDTGNHRVQKFDTSGNFVQTIGKKGQGPGEFEAATEIKIDFKSGGLFVKDKLLIIKRFNSVGEYIDEDIHFLEFLYDFHIDEENCIWGKFSNPSNNYLRRVGFDGVVKKEIAEIPYQLHSKMKSQRRVGSKTYVNGYFFNHGYEHDLFITKIDGSTFVYGDSRSYDLTVVDLELNILRRILREESHQRFTSAEKDRIKFGIQSSAAAKGRPLGDFDLDLPNYKPFFYSISSDELGRIFVLKTPATREYREVYEYDVFSSQGVYLYRVRIGCLPLVIKDGFLYTKTKNDETGVEIVKRFKIKNWTQLKQVSTDPPHPEANEPGGGWRMNT